MITPAVQDDTFDDVTKLQARYRNGETTPLAQVEACLARIDELNPHLHAFVNVFHESALKAAQEISAAFQREETPGALAGIPIAIKDLATTEEAPSAAGTSFLQDYLAAGDAAVVAALRQAGAIIIGKTAMTEGAFSEHHPSIAAPVNPWSPAHWTGVSSSGSGVAVAAGMVPLALGSDTGGSIRFPSACNHLVGHKPTYGQVSSAGTFFLAESLDHLGPIGRTVADCEAMYRVMSGNAAALVPPVSKRRIGVDFRQLAQMCATGVQEAISRVIEQYREFGFEIVDINLPPQQMQLAAGWLESVAWETARIHAPYRARHREDYGEAFGLLLALSEYVTAEQLQSLQSAKTNFSGQLDVLLHIVDAIICPVMPDPAQTTDDMAGVASTPDAITRSLAYTAPFNYSGHPALTLPAGFIEGVPTAYQLIGPRNGDQLLFDIARLHEAQSSWQCQRPDLQWINQGE